MSAQPLDLNSHSLITGSDRSHKLIDNCNQIDSQLALQSDNVEAMLSSFSGISDSSHSSDSGSDTRQVVTPVTEASHQPMKTSPAPDHSDSKPDLPDVNKTDRIKECIQQSVSEKTKRRITAIINEIQEFNDIEKLLLYLQLPNGSAQEADPLKQKGPGNPFGKKADVEVAQTYTWIQSHLEEDPTVSLPKQEVYEEYKVFCDASKLEPLCVADFGKAMKHVFPKVKPRRLGQRGNSKYCYSGLRKKVNIERPELPVLDTSGYEAQKTSVSWDSTTNHVHIEQPLAEAEVVVTWANKVLDQNLDSISQLSKYLLGSNSVDLPTTISTNAVSGCDDKPSGKPNSKSNNNCRRRDVQNQLQRKIHEKEALKEQKRRSDLVCKTSDSIKAVQTCAQKGIRKNRRNSASKSDELDTSASMASLGSVASLAIKTEPENEISTNFQTNRVQNKVAIPRTATPSRLSQPISTSIIIVPTATAVRLASPQSAQLTESTVTTMSSTVSALATTSPHLHTNPHTMANTSKYKRIQPKPVNICRSDSESAVCVNTSNTSNELFDTFNSLAKRRHSVSVPLSKDIKLRQLEILNDKQTQPKRQMDERDYSLLATKKRHIDNIQTIVSNNTNSSGFEDANSNNSLSPICQELNNISNNLETVGHSDIRIHELESEALMDYFNNSSVNSSVNPTNWESNNGNQKAQLSQLRKLLENHLPNNVTKLAHKIDHSTLDGYSELREALLRKNLNNSVNTLGSMGSTSMATTLSSDDSVAAICSNIKFEPKGRLSDTSIPSPDLENLSVCGQSQASESVQVFGNHSNEKNGFYSVNVQMPSVPPSPTARRRAFNFQPISPRNTPTIPENCAIDTIGYNGLVYNNASVCSPQYRVTQQTVAVGPSQPPSEANSPFVSPRSTPVTPMTPMTPMTPLPLSRSRHNSGQNNYTVLRQTPQQNFDSGVSSISNSPFISPQTTPLPMSRVRAGTGGAMQRTAVSRARHSSGPGGPITVTGMTGNLLCHRSNSLSPMIGDTMLTGSHILPHILSSSDLRSHLIAFGPDPNPNAITAKSRTPNSPLSPIAVLNNPDINCLTSDQINPVSSSAFNSECESIQQNEWTSIRMNTMNEALVANRQRHASNPYNSPSTPINASTSEQFNHEILSYLKNCGNQRPANEMQSNNRFLVSRCQSVPVATINSNVGLTYKVTNALTEPSLDVSHPLMGESTSVSKSYPATPICSQPFQFPPSPPSSTKQQMAFTGDDIISGNVLQSGQDLMVSGVELRDNSVWSTTIASSQANDNDLIAINTIGTNSSNARRNLNELLAEPPDDLQTTLEDLRDCDNDFSKFAQQLELEATDCTYDDMN